MHRARTANITRTFCGQVNCSSMQCGSELGEDVLFDDFGQRR
jgi:hypothetical protein